MIFLRDPNLLFLKPRKVAGTSFEIALSRFAGTDDIITRISPEDEATRRARGFPGPRNDRFTLADVASSPVQALCQSYCGGKKRKFYNHIPARDARERLGARTFDAALRVSIVRNPYDQLVSLYHWRNGKDAAPEGLHQWLLRSPDLISLNTAQYFIGGSSIIDVFLRFESFDADIRALETRVPALAGLAGTFTGLGAKTGLRPRDRALSDYFGAHPDLVAAVRFLNGAIIDRFGYDAGDGAARSEAVTELSVAPGGD